MRSSNRCSEESFGPRLTEPGYGSADKSVTNQYQVSCKKRPKTLIIFYYSCAGLRIYIDIDGLWMTNLSPQKFFVYLLNNTSFCDNRAQAVSTSEAQ